MLMFSGIVLLTSFPFFGALPEASAMPNDDLSTQLAKVEIDYLSSNDTICPFVTLLPLGTL